MRVIESTATNAVACAREKGLDLPGIRLRTIVRPSKAGGAAAR